MAEQGDSEDKTEEPTEERREQFRDEGMIPMSRELVSALVLFGVAAIMVSQAQAGLRIVTSMLVRHFEQIATLRINEQNLIEFFSGCCWEMLSIILPVAGAAAVIATAATFLQTRFAFSTKKLSPNFERLDPIKGLQRMVSMDSLMELTKGLAKLGAVAIVGYLILKGEVNRIPALMDTPIRETWRYWGGITVQLAFSVAALLTAIGAADYFYHWFTIQRKMRMSKDEIKQEFKNRETNPHVKGRQKAFARQIAMGKAVRRTKEATVIITNPTHFAVALKFDFTMRAPLVVAKGKDLIAQRIKEIGREHDIPIVENKALAQTLFKTVELGAEIPMELFKAVSEIILYVFKMKNIKIPRKATRGA